MSNWSERVVKIDEKDLCGDLELFLSEIGFKKGKNACDEIPELWGRLETGTPSKIIEFGWADCDCNKRIPISGRVIIRAMLTLRPSIWIQYACEDCNATSDAYKRNELTYSPKLKKMFVGFVDYCYGDGTVFGEKVNDEPTKFEELGRRKESFTYYPEPLDNEDLNVIAKTLNDNVFADLFGPYMPATGQTKEKDVFINCDGPVDPPYWKITIVSPLVASIYSALQEQVDNPSGENKKQVAEFKKTINRDSSLLGELCWVDSYLDGKMLEIDVIDNLNGIDGAATHPPHNVGDLGQQLYRLLVGCALEDGLDLDTVGINAHHDLRRGDEITESIEMAEWSWRGFVESGEAPAEIYDEEDAFVEKEEKFIYERENAKSEFNVNWLC